MIMCYVFLKFSAAEAGCLPRRRGSNLDNTSRRVEIGSCLRAKIATLSHIGHACEVARNSMGGKKLLLQRSCVAMWRRDFGRLVGHSTAGKTVDRAGQVRQFEIFWPSGVDGSRKLPPYLGELGYVGKVISNGPQPTISPVPRWTCKRHAVGLVWVSWSLGWKVGDSGRVSTGLESNTGLRMQGYEGRETWVPLACRTTLSVPTEAGFRPKCSCTREAQAIGGGILRAARKSRRRSMEVHLQLIGLRFLLLLQHLGPPFSG